MGQHDPQVPRPLTTRTKSQLSPSSKIIDDNDDDDDDDDDDVRRHGGRSSTRNIYKHKNKANSSTSASASTNSRRRKNTRIILVTLLAAVLFACFWIPFYLVFYVTTQPQSQLGAQGTKYHVKQQRRGDDDNDNNDNSGTSSALSTMVAEHIATIRTTSTSVTTRQDVSGETETTATDTDNAALSASKSNNEHQRQEQAQDQDTQEPNNKDDADDVNYPILINTETAVTNHIAITNNTKTNNLRRTQKEDVDDEHVDVDVTLERAKSQSLPASDVDVDGDADGSSTNGTVTKLERSSTSVSTADDVAATARQSKSHPQRVINSTNATGTQASVINNDSNHKEQDQNENENVAASTTTSTGNSGAHETDETAHESTIKHEHPHPHSPYEEGIAACLLVKDDNHRLVEWLAYHYTMLPLRRLIIAVDPGSLTSPHRILQRWTGLSPSPQSQSHHNNNTSHSDAHDSTTTWHNRTLPTLPYPLRAELWQDEDYFTSVELKDLHYQYRCTAIEKNDIITKWHRVRQNRFLAKCSQQLYSEKQYKYVALVDTDEYITFNHVGDPILSPDPPYKPSPRGERNAPRKRFQNAYIRHHLLPPPLSTATTADTTTVTTIFDYVDQTLSDYDDYHNHNSNSSSTKRRKPPVIGSVTETVPATTTVQPNGKFNTTLSGTILTRTFLVEPALTLAVPLIDEGPPTKDENGRDTKATEDYTVEDSPGKQELSPCIGMSRLFFGAKEIEEHSDVEALLNSQVKKGLQQVGVAVANSDVVVVNSSPTSPSTTTTQTTESSESEALQKPIQTLDTLRYVYHAVKGGYEHNKWGKVLIDLSRVPSADMLTYQAMLGNSVHKPFQGVCQYKYTNYLDSLLRVHHYVGSYENYSSRTDTRRTAAEFQKKIHVHAGASLDMTTWLPHFVALVGGADTASYLLQGVGGTAGNGKYYVDPEEDQHPHHPQKQNDGGAAEEGAVPPPARQTKDEKEKDETVADADATKTATKTASSYTCALLFYFGGHYISSQAWEENILPALEMNVLDSNPNCDIYIHTFHRSGKASTDTTYTDLKGLAMAQRNQVSRYQSSFANKGGTGNKVDEDTNNMDMIAPNVALDTVDDVEVMLRTTKRFVDANAINVTQRLLQPHNLRPSRFLTPPEVVDSLDTVHEKRAHRKATTDNFQLFEKWISLERVWKLSLMQEDDDNDNDNNATRSNNTNTTGATPHPYDIIGIFPLHLRYIHPIRIVPSSASASDDERGPDTLMVPSSLMYTDLHPSNSTSSTMHNDGIVYGPRSQVEQWMTADRFAALAQFDKHTATTTTSTKTKTKLMDVRPKVTELKPVKPKSMELNTTTTVNTTEAKISRIEGEAKLVIHNTTEVRFPVPLAIDSNHFNQFLVHHILLLKEQLQEDAQDGIGNNNNAIIPPFALKGDADLCAHHVLAHKKVKTTDCHCAELKRELTEMKK
jgi:hypothetical protein